MEVTSVEAKAWFVELPYLDSDDLHLQARGVYYGTRPVMRNEGTWWTIYGPEQVEAMTLLENMRPLVIVIVIEWKQSTSAARKRRGTWRTCLSRWGRMSASPGELSRRAALK